MQTSGSLAFIQAKDSLIELFDSDPHDWSGDPANSPWLVGTGRTWSGVPDVVMAAPRPGWSRHRGITSSTVAAQTDAVGTPVSTAWLADLMGDNELDRGPTDVEVITARDPGTDVLLSGLLMAGKREPAFDLVGGHGEDHCILLMMTCEPAAETIQDL